MVTKQRPYKWIIRESIMEALYSKMSKIRQEELFNIVQYNTLIRNYPHQSFVFHGEFFCIDGAGDGDGPPIRQRLDNSLHPKMMAYLDEFGYNLSLEKAKIIGYLSSMLAYSALPGDYLLLLPTALHEAVRASVICDWSTELTPEKITLFMDKYRQGYELLRLRMATNLIL